MRLKTSLYASILGIGIALCFAPFPSRAHQAATGKSEKGNQDVIIIILPPTYTEGDYRYSVTNGMATIVKFSNTAYEGALTITNSLGGYPVVEINQNAFARCSKLTDVTVPDGVTNIWSLAFSMCYNLRSVSLPATLSGFSFGSPFFQCNSLEAISVDTANPSYWSDAHGVLYCRTTSTLFCHPPAATNDYYVITDGVTNIETRAFFGSRYRTESLSLPVYIILGQKLFPAVSV